TMPTPCTRMCSVTCLSGLRQQAWCRRSGLARSWTRWLQHGSGGIRTSDPAKLVHLRERMNAAVADSIVTGYEQLIDGLKLPDPKDRHVPAAAIRAGAEVIVTSNMKDFPSSDLAEFNIEAKSPDDFVLDQIHAALRLPPS